MADVSFDSGDGDVQSIGHSGVGKTQREQAQNLYLAFAQGFNQPFRSSRPRRRFLGQRGREGLQEVPGKLRQGRLGQSRIKSDEQIPHGLATIEEEAEIARTMGQRQAFLEGRLRGDPPAQSGVRQRLEQQGFHLPAPASRASREGLPLKRKRQSGLRLTGHKMDASLIEQSVSKG